MVKKTTSNGWEEWGKHVLAELQRLNENYESMRSDVAEIKNDFLVFKTEMKIKSGVWGFLGGLISAIGAAILYLLRTVK